MSSDELSKLQAAVMAQAERLRTLKAEGKSKKELEGDVKKLKELKKQLDILAPKTTVDNSAKFNRPGCEDLMKRRFFYCNSFEIYGGVAGFFDFGPPGCAVKDNLLTEWKKHFVLAENMLQIACTGLTPEIVLKTSGHAERFADFLVKDVKTGDPFRADHVLEGKLKQLIEKTKDAKEKDRLEVILGQVDGYDKDKLGALLKEFKCTSPDTGNDLTDPIPFNLMFETSIGPSGLLPGFLRPETAQGIFLNFNRLLNYNNGHLPFAAAQIGDAYRNEIAPRSGLLRVREFTMAEIEHFVHPEHKQHPRFPTVASLTISLYGANAQLANAGPKPMTIGEAVTSGLVDNETLGYFIARTHLFLTGIGIKPEHLRFRQHLPTEMAHYACDCWDAEIECSYGWVECVGIADRSCYDLEVHSKESKASLTAFEKFDKEVLAEEVQAKVNKQATGKALRKDAKPVLEYVEGLSDEEKHKHQASLDSTGKMEVTVGGKAFTLSKDMISFETVTVKKSGRNFYPSVVEPSFGVGRIIYCLMEHSYWHREGDEQRSVLSLPPAIAPVKVAVLPLSATKDFDPFLETIVRDCSALGLAYKVDTSGASIGKRYARTDEIAVPFGLTVDFDTIKEGSVTLRERDSTEQVRGPLTDMVKAVKCMVEGIMTWEDVKRQWPLFTTEAA